MADAEVVEALINRAVAAAEVAHDVVARARAAAQRAMSLQRHVADAYSAEQAHDAPRVERAR